MSYVLAAYTLVLVTLALYALSLEQRRRQLRERLGGARHGPREFRG